MDKVSYYDVALDDSPQYDVDIFDNQLLDTTMESEVRVNGSGGNYLNLTNKPRIEGIVLNGDKTFRELGLNDITPQDIDEIIFGGG